MKVIVDTVIWSLALRRGETDVDVRRELTGLIEDQRVIVLGPIRQELLSGYSNERAFERLRSRLDAFENEPITDEDYVRAAQYSNACRAKGVQGSHTDFLICACAVRLEAGIYTRDRDFDRYAEILPILLYRETGRTAI
jgi:hypothetical protein